MSKRLIYFALATFLLFVLPTSWSTRLRDRTGHWLAPLASSLVHQHVRWLNISRSLGQISTLREDKSNLERQVASLQQQLADQKDVLRENQELRREVGVTGFTKNEKKVFTHIIIQGNDPADRTFTVDVGTNQGVQVGQAAIDQGALVGRVIAVRENTAIIRSIISAESRIQAWLADSHEKGLLIGDGSSAYLSNITQGVPVKDQTIIETSGLGGSLPQGLLIGQTGSLLSQKNDLSQKFQVRLTSDPASLDSLFILLTNSQ